MKLLLSDLILYPMPGIYLILFGLLLSRGKLRKAALGLGAASLVLLSFPVTSKLLVRPLLVTGQSMEDIKAAAPDVILVPTGGIKQIDDEEYAPNIPTVTRLTQARQLQSSTQIPMIVSGGDPKRVGAAESFLAAKAGLTDPATAILDEDALNTAGNVDAFVSIMKVKGYRKPVLVTQSVHMRRTAAILKAQGFTPLAYPAWEEVATPVEAADFLPGRNGYDAANRVAIAYAAIAKYLIQGHFQWHHLTSVK